VRTGSAKGPAPAPAAPTAGRRCSRPN
jgi:hypothetical protein